LDEKLKKKISVGKMQYLPYAKVSQLQICIMKATVMAYILNRWYFGTELLGHTLKYNLTYFKYQNDDYTPISNGGVHSN
jgi:hypothetical protein